VARSCGKTPPHSYLSFACAPRRLTLALLPFQQWTWLDNPLWRLWGIIPDFPSFPIEDWIDNAETRWPAGMADGREWDRVRADWSDEEAAVELRRRARAELEVQEREFRQASAEHESERVWDKLELDLSDSDSDVEVVGPYPSPRPSPGYNVVSKRPTPKSRPTLKPVKPKAHALLD